MYAEVLFAVCTRAALGAVLLAAGQLIHPGSRPTGPTSSKFCRSTCRAREHGWDFTEGRQASVSYKTRWLTSTSVWALQVLVWYYKYAFDYRMRVVADSVFVRPQGAAWTRRQAVAPVMKREPETG